MLSFEAKCRVIDDTGLDTRFDTGLSSFYKGNILLDWWGLSAREFRVIRMLFAPGELDKPFIDEVPYLFEEGKISRVMVAG